MSSVEFTLDHAQALVNRITQDDDGAHANDLLQLIHAIADPNSVIAIEVEKYLYSMTPDFQSHFRAYLARLKAA